MANPIPRIERNLIFNKPHLICQESFNSIMEHVTSRSTDLMTSSEMAISTEIESRNKRDKNLGEGTVATLSVEGVLSYKETMWTALCGMTTYQGLLEQMRQAIDENYSVVLLDVNSGGGEAYNCFSAARALREMADENGIKLVAYVDGMSASAAYALSTAAHEIIMHPQAQVGSIGVLTRLVNDSEKMKKEGIEVTYISAGDNKIPFDAEGNWREGFLEDIQDSVNELYNEFVDHVATMRNIDPQAVIDTQAKIYNKDKAKELGLVDSVMEHDEFYNYLADLAEGKNMPINLGWKQKKEDNMSDKTTQAAVESQVAEMSAEDKAQLQDMKAQLAELQAQNKALAEAKENTEKATLASQLQELAFIDESTSKELASVLHGFAGKDTVLKVLSKADAAVEEGATTTLSVEDEGEEPNEDPKANLKAQMQAKYQARNK